MPFIIHAIGIDPGTRTGIAIKDLATGQFVLVDTMPIHRALETVLNHQQMEGIRLYFVIEDARNRRWFDDRHMNEKARNGLRQGAGSVKRDCSIWEDFLTDHGHTFVFQAPRKGATKITPAMFARLTGWTGRTSEHARDAAMLVQGVNGRNLKLLFSKSAAL